MSSSSSLAKPSASLYVVGHMDYSIPWSLLPEDDADFFDEAHIERGPAHVKFNRELSRQELASVCSRLWNFRLLIPDADDNSINFAIGDALNEFSNRFGEKDGDYFKKAFVRISRVRDHTLEVTGGTLIYLQNVEHLIKGCCAMLKLKGLKLTLDDFNSLDPSRRRQTLGHLKRALLGTFQFSSAFAHQFDGFVEDRNKFVHTLWIGELAIDKRAGLPSEAYYQKKLKFTISVMRQTRYIELIFRGLLSSIGISLSKKQKQELVFPWKKYISHFQGVLRKIVSDLDLPMQPVLWYKDLIPRDYGYEPT